MATSETIWIADGVPNRTFDTEAEAILAERVNTLANTLGEIFDEFELMGNAADDVAKWILANFVPKEPMPGAPQAPQTPGPGHNQPAYGIPQAPQPPGPEELKVRREIRESLGGVKQAPGSTPKRSMDAPISWGHETPEAIKRPYLHIDADWRE